ncbi:MAG: DUF4838 domain-containing protein [bacterium]
MLVKFIESVFAFCITLVTIFLFFYEANAQEEIILTNEETTEYRIMVGPQATDTEIFAAQELQGYLLQISGAFMPMANENERTYKKLILVGKNAAKLMLPESAFDQLHHDDFFIKVIGYRLILAGNSPRATLYSVYSFLENLGCRWFAPGVIGEVIPRLPGIVLTTINHVERPSIKYRGFMCLFENTCQSVNWIDWMAKNKLNYVMTSQTNFEIFNNTLYGEARKRGILIGFRVFADAKTNLEQIVNFINNNPTIDIIEIATDDFKLALLLKEIYQEKIISILIVGDSAILADYDFKDSISLSYESDSRCYKHLLDDSNCKINRDYRIFIEKVSNKYKTVFIHEYYMGSYEQNSFPFPILNSIVEDTRYFFRKGIDGVISQSEIGNWGTYGLNYFVFSKIVWNSEYNLGTIVDDYCEKYYGTASQYMKEYFSILENTIESTEHLQYIDSPEKILSIINEETLHEMEIQIENAKIHADEVTIFDRIRKVQISFDYMKLLWRMIKFYSEANRSSKNEQETKKDLQIVIESGEQLLNHLVNNVDEEVFIVTESYVLDFIEPIITDARIRLQ